MTNTQSVQQCVDVLVPCRRASGLFCVEFAIDGAKDKIQDEENIGTATKIKHLKGDRKSFPRARDADGQVSKRSAQDTLAVRTPQQKEVPEAVGEATARSETRRNHVGKKAKESPTDRARRRQRTKRYPFLLVSIVEPDQCLHLFLRQFWTRIGNDVE